ncbi:MAG: hypothetical protein K9N52_01905 [Verrucomicrobia bacterium]|nr:hypothetical protein [Verrucomicrobiota bacterium]
MRDQSSERDCAESRSRLSEEDVGPGNRMKPWHSQLLRLILRTQPRSDGFNATVRIKDSLF